MEPQTSIISHNVKFWLLLTALVPSIACSIAILYYILSDREQRRAIHNHVIIILLFNGLIYELIDTTLFLNYYRLGTVQPASEIFCVIWEYADEAIYSISTMTVAWASIERHILIFHRHWIHTTRRRVLLHYIPLVSLISYIILFHFTTIFFTKCKDTNDYNLEMCGHPLCLHDSVWVGRWDNIFNDIIPTLIIVIFSIALLVRVLIKNCRVRKTVQWRKHRKMAFQLLSISALYMVLFVPVIITEMARLSCTSCNTPESFDDFIAFFSNYVIFLLPFVYLISLQEGLQKLKYYLLAWFPARRQVHPVALLSTATYVAQQSMRLGAAA